jgi:hypothetical protein
MQVNIDLYQGRYKTVSLQSSTARVFSVSYRWSCLPIDPTASAPRLYPAISLTLTGTFQKSIIGYCDCLDLYNKPRHIVALCDVVILRDYLPLPGHPRSSWRVSPLLAQRSALVQRLSAFSAVPKITTRCSGNLPYIIATCCS